MLDTGEHTSFGPRPRDMNEEGYVMRKRLLVGLMAAAGHPGDLDCGTSLQRCSEFTHFPRRHRLVGRSRSLPRL